MTLVRIVKNWDWPDLFRQIPGNGRRWGRFEFTEEEVGECDHLLVLNRVARPLRVRVPPENVWMLVQEPAIDTMDFVWEGHERFARVLTHHPMTPDEKYITCHPAIPWHVGRSYDQLTALAPFPKDRHASVIASNLSHFEGHRRRYEFVEHLRETDELDLEFFGKGTRFIEDKWDGIAPFRFSVAIENSSTPDYWTEKLADCFLSWTVPLYFGCTNVFDYFPRESIIWLPIDEPAAAVAILKSLTEEDWYRRIDALRAARSLVLDQYQFFPQVTRLMDEHGGAPAGPSSHRSLRLPVREESFSYRLRRKRRHLMKKFLGHAPPAPPAKGPR